MLTAGSVNFSTDPTQETTATRRLYHADFTASILQSEPDHTDPESLSPAHKDLDTT